MKIKLLAIIFLSTFLIILTACDGVSTEELLDTQANMIIKDGSMECIIEDSYLTVTIDYTLENIGDEEVCETVLKNSEFKETIVEYINIAFDEEVVEITGESGEAISEKVTFPKAVFPGETIDIKINYGVSGLKMPDGGKMTWRWVVPYLDATALTEEISGIPISIVIDEDIELVSSVPLGFKKEGNVFNNKLNGLTNMIILEVSD